MCAVHYILLRNVGRGLERKERWCWKCRHNMTDVARYVCCLIITNDRSVKIKWRLLQDLQLCFTKYKMSAWCGEHARPSVIYQWLKHPSYCDIRYWGYFKKLWSSHDFHKVRLSDSHTLRKAVHELFLPVLSIFLADLGNIGYHAHVSRSEQLQFHYGRHSDTCALHKSSIDIWLVFSTFSLRFRLNSVQVVFTNINLVIMSFPKIDAVKALLVVGRGGIFILTCDTYCPIVVKFITRRDVDVVPLGLYEVRENQHRKGRNFR